MPIYTYHCNNCQDERDYILTRIGQKPEYCDSCNGRDFTRVFDKQRFGTPIGDANVYIDDGQESRTSVKDSGSRSSGKTLTGIIGFPIFVVIHKQV